MSKTEAAKIVLQFLKDENRPYAINEILAKCGKELGKSAVQK